MVYLYRLAWIWYDDYEPYVLVHEKQFTENEWLGMVRKAMSKAVDELLQGDASIGGIEIVEKTVEKLCELYGFRKAMYVGDLEIVVPMLIDRWCLRDEVVRRLARFIGEERFRRIIEHNQTIIQGFFVGRDMDG
ncbi:MAG: hypothetical protein GXO43_06065 [Crenarchaeota archaeon]|nr:hypothetical protein [Thermoproteota archaeon]